MTSMTSMTLPALPPVSSLEAYVQAVNRIPMLTLEKELELGRRLRDHADLSAACRRRTSSRKATSAS